MKKIIAIILIMAVGPMALSIANVSYAGTEGGGYGGSGNGGGYGKNAPETTFILDGGGNSGGYGGSGFTGGQGAGGGDSSMTSARKPIYGPPGPYNPYPLPPQAGKGTGSGGQPAPGIGGRPGIRGGPWPGRGGR
jgi:hypothetical protein